MGWNQIVQEFITGVQQTQWYEYVAVIAGIASVAFSRSENVLVYPVGLINTILYIYLSFQGGLLGEATVNLYYTIMSIYGWILWTRRGANAAPLLHVTFASRKEWIQHLAFFAFFYLAIYFSLIYLKKAFIPGAIPWADALASASAFTGMWLMAKKKVESWIWWIITNMASIPLYFVKHYVVTSVYYIILLVMAVFGLITWIRKAKQEAHAY